MALMTFISTFCINFLYQGCPPPCNGVDDFYINFLYQLFVSTFCINFLYQGCPPPCNGVDDFCINFLYQLFVSGVPAPICNGGVGEARHVTSKSLQMPSCCIDIAALSNFSQPSSFAMHQHQARSIHVPPYEFRSHIFEPLHINGATSPTLGHKWWLCPWFCGASRYCLEFPV